MVKISVRHPVTVNEAEAALDQLARAQRNLITLMNKQSNFYRDQLAGSRAIEAELVGMLRRALDIASADAAPGVLDDMWARLHELSKKE